jgi:hypothetical protein
MTKQYSGCLFHGSFNAAPIGAALIYGLMVLHFQKKWMGRASGATNSQSILVVNRLEVRC